MRKGFFLIELLVVLAVISLLSVPLARLSTTTLRDIPQSWRMIESNTRMLNMLKQMRKDVNAAKGFPESFNALTADNTTLLIRLEDEVICYQLKEDKIVRRSPTCPGTGNDEEIRSWTVRYGKVQWRYRYKNGRVYAVEVETYIERKIGDCLEKKMANSHLYFAGAFREAVKKK